MGLFDKIKNKMGDTHTHKQVSIPERIDATDGKIYIQEDYRYGVELVDITNYSYLKDGDEITFKEDAGRLHAYFDDSVDVGVIKSQEIIDMIYGYAEKGKPFIANMCPSSMTIRIGFYKPLDKSKKTAPKLKVSFTTESCYEDVGDTVGCEYDISEDVYAIVGTLDNFPLSKSNSQKIEKIINTGFDPIDGVIIEKDLTDSDKEKVTVELRFQ